MNASGMSLPTLEIIIERLPVIFPEGIEHRNYVTREMAGRTIFAMFYVGALQGSERWLRPDQVTKMTDTQAAKTFEKERLTWARLSLTPGGLKRLADTWYAANTREPIRDETLRMGLIPKGAVVERSGLPTTSALPRYALEKDFAELFDAKLIGKRLEAQIKKWQKNHLSFDAVARIKLLKRSAAFKTDVVRVRFPDGNGCFLSPGPSSSISKAVIEEFTKRYLHAPVVLWVSESGSPVVPHHEDLAKTIGIRIEPDKNLPDIILVDTGSPDLLVVFVEVVATDGPINALRKEALLRIASRAGFKTKQVAFLTAFADRAAPAFRKASADLAWGSFVWFASEPQHVIVLRDGQQKSKKLNELL